ncbi:MAG: UvrD-helicase domain-containing protein [Chlamydiota bacterium]
MSSPAFDVLDRKTRVNRSMLLEASAGTGKTFAIENLVVRLLVEGDYPCLLEQILVVTFTRKATLELKERVRANIIKAYNDLQKGESETDYIQGWIDQKQKEHASRRLERALLSYDDAQVYTIHSFCFRMLQENVLERGIGGELDSVEDNLSQNEMKEVVKDFFRTSLSPDDYSSQQLKMLLSKDSDFDHLVNAVLRNISKKGVVRGALSFQEALESFREKMLVIKHRLPKDLEIVEHYRQVALNYKTVCTSSGEIKPEIWESLEHFAAIYQQVNWSPEDFDGVIGHGLEFARRLNNKNLKVYPKYKGPNYFEEILEELGPLIHQASDPALLIARLSRDCKRMLKGLFKRQEKFTFDYLLELMMQSIEKKAFLKHVQKKYRAAIIDEFQDTDNMQWQIFKKLFFDDHRLLYLIGDPKQAIYAFRNADVYTYLEASQALGDQGHLTLATNYRSQPHLVEALNFLFSEKNSPAFLPLPRQKDHLPYQEVKASLKVQKPVFCDDKGSLHFMINRGKIGRGDKWPSIQLEEEQIFPNLAQEIAALRHRFDYQQFAVLVRDRYQASRLEEFLRLHNIPAVTRRSRSIIDSPALDSFKEVIKAAIDPRDYSALKAALANPIIAWDTSHIRNTFEKGLHQEVVAKFYTLKAKLFKGGFANFWSCLQEMHWEDGTTIQRILKRRRGRDLYHELTYLAELLIEYQTTSHATPEGLVRHLDYLKSLDPDDDECLKIPAEPLEDAVNILTMHISKGLEFDVVFALGLSTRTTSKDEVVSVYDRGQNFLVTSDSDRELYRNYCQEADAEKMRQLYVVMTRAKYRLYVPVVLEEDHKEVPLGHASPLELFLSQLGQPACDYLHQYQRIKEYDINSLTSLLDDCSEDITYSLQGQREQKVFVEPMLSPKIELEPPGWVTVPQRRQHNYSFTGIAKTLKRGENVAPDDFRTPQKTPHTLPAGSHTGRLLHRILEDIMLKGKNLSLRKIVHKYTRGTLFEEWDIVIEEMLYRLLSSPIKLPTTTIILNQLAPEKLFTEMDFLFALDHSVLFNGSIDLFFEWEGKYYLLDWKSNWIGDNDQAYRQESLEEVMQAHDYHLQAEIYCQAIKKYLAITASSSFEECFGGVLYCFVRGPAFYHFIPKPLDLEDRICRD